MPWPETTTARRIAKCPTRARCDFGVDFSSMRWSMAPMVFSEDLAGSGVVENTPTN
jgi:hypothetical protein